MIIGVISDTHHDKMNALPHIMQEFKKRGVELIIHCGDIDSKHLKPELFLNLPVICALIEEQMEKPEFKNPLPSSSWRFTTPGDRVRYLEDGTGVYVGHKRSYEYLNGSETALMNMMQEVRKNYDNVRWMFSGHTHHQIFAQTRLTNFVNPGAVEYAFDGYEFAVLDTENSEVVFSWILTTRPVIEPFSVGVISDSANISEIDPEFWAGLAKEFKKRDVGYIIHCGNIKTSDIGKPELEDFEFFYKLHPKQQRKPAPEHWNLIDDKDPVFEIRGYRFQVWYDLSAALLDQSEVDMNKLCLGLRKKYPDLGFILSGLTNNALLEEGQQVRIVNPGDVIQDRNFAVICLPRTEITFGHVPLPSLPPI